MSTIFGCAKCGWDFDGDRTALCVHCKEDDPDAREYFRSRIRLRLKDIVEDAERGGLTKLELEHLLSDVWPD